MFSLKNFFLFKGLEDEEIKELSKSFKSEKYSAGSEIYGAENFRRALGIVICGKCAAYEGDTEKKSFKDGDVFGAAAIYGSGENYISEIRAVSDCEICFLQEEEVKEIIRNNSVCAENYIVFLSDKIRYLNSKISHYAGGDAEKRILQYLKDNARDNKIIVKNMSETAKLTGLSRSQFYAAMEKLEGKNMIEKHGKIIAIKR